MRRQNITIFDSLSNSPACDGLNTYAYSMRLKYLHSENILQGFGGYY